MLSKLRKLYKNKEVKVLFENFISLSALQVVGMLLSLITLPYLIRILGFENYGTVILALSLIAYFKSVVDYSFRITATRDVSIYNNSPQKLNLIYSRVITVKAILLLFSFIVISGVVILYPPFYEERTVFFLTMLLLLGYALFPEWYFQGIEKMKYISILNISIKVFFTICVFIFIKEKEDYWIYPLLQSGGMIGAGLVGQYILVKKYKLKFIWLKQKRIKESFFSNFPIFVNQFFPTLYNNTSSFLLGLIAGSSYLGIYDAIKKVIDLSIAFLSVISRVFFPFINRKKHTFYIYKKLMLSLSILSVICLLSLHQLVFWYLNVKYENAIYLLLILSISIIGYALYDIFGLNYFIVKRQDKLVMKNTLIASLFGLMTAFPLIYFFGIGGAAINLCVTRWVMGGTLMVKWYKYEKN